MGEGREWFAEWKNLHDDIITSHRTALLFPVIF